MYYFEYPTTDTTLFEGGVTSSINAGHDEILEVRKNMNSNGTTISVSRILIISTKWCNTKYCKILFKSI